MTQTQTHAQTQTQAQAQAQVQQAPLPDEASLAAYRASAAEFLATAQIPAVPAAMEDRFNVLRGWQQTLFEGGWMGIDWPRDAGGQGLSPLHAFAFAEELARAGAPLPIGLVGVEVIGPTIIAHGTAEQRAALLPPLLSGGDIWCQGFSEPDAGSDLASLRTAAKRDGDEWVITGQKVWTSWAHKATWCALLARTDPDAPRHKGISYLLVDMASPGITTRPIRQITGDEEFCEVFFDGVRIPAGAMLGQPGEGWSIAMNTLSHERSGYGLRRRVEAEVALDAVVARVAAHLRGGAPAGRAAQLLGRAYVAVRVLEASTRAMTARHRDGAGPSAIDSVDKLTLSQTEGEIYRCLADLLGSARLSPDTPPGGLDAPRLAYDQLYSRAAAIYGGSEQIQRNIIAERFLGLPRG